MRRVVLFIAVSLDGYIADTAGGVAWLAGDGSGGDDMESYREFIETVDTVVLGYQTYHQIVTELSPGSWTYSGKTSYVLTHRQNLESTSEILFTNQSPAGLVTELKNKPGKNIWICGGASIVGQLRQPGLIDRFHLSVIPTLLGDGIRLFEKRESETPLRLISTRSYNGITDLVYECRS